MSREPHIVPLHPPKPERLDIPLDVTATAETPEPWAAKVRQAKAELAQAQALEAVARSYPRSSRDGR